MVQYGTIWYNMVQPCKAITAKGTTEPVARCKQSQVLSTFTEYFNFTGYFYSIDKFLFLISISSSSCQSLDNFEEKTTFRTGYGLPPKKMIHTKPTKLIFSTITISLV